MAAARQRRLRPVGALRAVTKKVWLEGHPFDLQALAELLPSGDTRVVREDDQFYLTSSDIENPPDRVKPYVVAKGLLPTINGLARVHNPDFRPVELSGKYTDGGSTTIFSGAGTLEIRVGITGAATVTDKDGNIVFPRPSPWPDRYALTRSHTDLADALKIMARSKSLGWRDLYDVFEIIRRSVTEKKMRGLGWATKKRLSLFTHSAQQERHARPSSVPETPMSLAEGRDFVNGLVIEWMRSLAP
jgi:hypothetical protein